MSNETSAISLLRAQYGQAKDWFLGTMQGVTEELAHQAPAGNPSSIAGQAAHTVTGLDFFVLGAAGGKSPLFSGSFAGKAGISEPPPQGGDWSEWGRSVQVQLPAMLEYTEAVFAGIDEYLASLTDSDLERELDLGPIGTQTVGWVFNIMLLNTYSHTGEIACLKGQAGLKGYPF